MLARQYRKFVLLTTFSINGYLIKKIPRHGKPRTGARVMVTESTARRARASASTIRPARIASDVWICLTIYHGRRLPLRILSFVKVGVEPAATWFVCKGRS